MVRKKVRKKERKKEKHSVEHCVRTRATTNAAATSEVDTTRSYPSLKRCTMTQVPFSASVTCLMNSSLLMKRGSP